MHDFAYDAKWLASSRKHADVLAIVQNLICEFGRCLQDVLAIVEDEQRVLASERRHDPLFKRAPLLLADTQGLCYDACGQASACDRRKVAEPNAVRVKAGEIHADGERPPRL